MSTRFVTANGNETDAINKNADLANFNGESAYLARTAGAVTLTAAQMLNGVVKQAGTPGAFNMTTPTAAEIIAAIPNAQVGSSADFALINGGDATVTMVAGDSVTLVGTTAVPTSKTQIYKILVTSSTAVSVIGLLTAPV